MVLLVTMVNFPRLWETSLDNYLLSVGIYKEIIPWRTRLGIISLYKRVQPKTEYGILLTVLDQEVSVLEQYSSLDFENI